jgi:hypothetical protein
VLGEAPGLVLGEDRVAVADDVELALAAWDLGCLEAVGA